MQIYEYSQIYNNTFFGDEAHFISNKKLQIQFKYYFCCTIILKFYLL